MNLSYSAFQRFYTNYYREPRGEVFEKLYKLAALYETKPNPYATLTRDHLERHWFELSLLPHEGENRLVRFTNLMLRLRVQDLREKKFAAQNKQTLAHDGAVVPMLNMPAQLTLSPNVACVRESQTTSALSYTTRFPSVLPKGSSGTEMPARLSTEPVSKSFEPRTGPSDNNKDSVCASAEAPTHPRSETIEPSFAHSIAEVSRVDHEALPGSSTQETASPALHPPGITQLPAFTRLYPHLFENPNLAPVGF